MAELQNRYIFIYRHRVGIGHRELYAFRNHDIQLSPAYFDRIVRSFHDLNRDHFFGDAAHLIHLIHLNYTAVHQFDGPADHSYSHHAGNTGDYAAAGPHQGPQRT